MLVCGYQSGSIKVWSILQWKEEFSLVGHSASVTSLAVSPDNSFIFSGSSDKTIRQWSILDQQEECTLLGHTGPILSVLVSSDGLTLASQSEDKSVRIWGIPERRQEYLFKDHADTHRLVISPDLRYIVNVLKDSSIKLWNVKERREECTFIGHTSVIHSVAVSQDGRFLATGSGDYIYGEGECVIRLWNIPERREQCVFMGYTNPLDSLVISPDCRFIVGRSYYDRIRIWRIQEQNAQLTEMKYKDPARPVIMSPDGRFLMSALGSISIWNVQEQRNEPISLGRSIVVSPDGRYIASSADSSLKIWNVLEWREECTLNGHTSHISSVAVSPDSRFVVTGSFDKTVKIWNVKDRREEFTLRGHEHFVNRVTISPDSRFILSDAGDRTTRIWNLQERREECIIRHEKDVYSAIVSLDGVFLFRNTGDTCIVWNIQESREQFTFNNLHKITSFIISADQRFLISKSNCNKVKILNLYTKQFESFSLKTHANILQYIASLSNTGSNLQICQVYVTRDYLLLSSVFGVCERIKREDGHLQLTSDLGLSLSKDQFTDYNFVYYAWAKDLVSVPSAMADVSYGPLRLSLGHYYSHLGLKGNLQKLVENQNFLLKADAFYKSPFYYAILKKRQDCVDLLLEGLEIMRVKNRRNYEESLYAIRNDIVLLISNSPRQLHTLLSNVIASCNQAYARIPGYLPILQLGVAPNCKIEDFPSNGPEEISVELQTSIFPLLGGTGSLHNIALLDAIINCKNSQAIRSPVIHHIIELQFNAVKHWVIYYTMLLFANIIVLMLLIGLNSFDLYLVVPFMLINALLLAFEVAQMATNSKEYLQDPWNFLDISRNIASVAWIILGLYGYNSLPFTWVVALINLLRGITGFHLFDSTRFYIDLIFTSLSDIKYFFLMFSYSTFTFGCLLMISRDQSLSFDGIWGDSYNLNFGNYENADTGIYFMQYIVYFGATVVNVVLMLNLLISILGDSYERFQLEQTIVDIKEKARISMEYQSMMFWTNKESQLLCIRVCKSAFQDEEDQEWEGRMRFMDKKLDKGIKELTDSNNSIGKGMDLISSSIEEKVKSSIDSLDTKIQDTIQAKMKECSESIRALEAKMMERDQSMEAKIK